jgi:hypothetical protein
MKLRFPNTPTRAYTRVFLVMAALLCAATAPLGAQDDFVPVYHPELTISRAAGRIDIDGELGDEGWRGAARADNFAEHNPGDQIKPAVDTEVLITYDDNNLYVAWLCYDNPDEVRASFCERDNIFSDDYVILCLDTYGDATLAYEIASNPYGIPGDLLFSSTNGEDGSYDMIFETAGRITDFGWVVEMAVPFASMRFPGDHEQEWRVDFWRNRPRGSRFQYSWAAYDRDENCWPCQWGTVRGIEGVKPGAGLELLPAVVSSQYSGLGEAGDLEHDPVEADFGLGVAFDFSSELTGEMTLNPDFSQVESDAAQIDVNTTFALFYPERRPFFQEGSDLFDTYFNAVYTRSINDPLVAGKLTWRKGSNSVALLSAQDDHSVVILPFEESSEFLVNGESYSNILRVRRDLGGQSHIGLVATDRRFRTGGSGTLAGVDGQWRFSASNWLKYQYLATYTDEPEATYLADSTFNNTRFDGGNHTAGLDGETFWGHAWTASLGRNTSNYWFGTDYWERSPTFRADNGFEPSNSIRQGAFWGGAIKRFEESGFWENINVSMNAGQKYNFENIKKDEWINTSLEIVLKAAQTGMHASYMRSNELFGDIQFDDIWQVHNCFRTQPSQALRFGGYGNYGHRIARYDLVMGEEFSYGAWADIRPIDRILISPSYDYVQSDDLDTGERLFSQSVFRTRISLQLSREFSARLITQYNDRWNSWDIDPLLTYRINSLTVFYIGSSNDFQNLIFEDDGRVGWTLTDRQFFLKLQYLFRI